MTGLLDSLIVILVVASAVAWLAWRFFGPGRTSSSCATGCGKCEDATAKRSPLRVVGSKRRPGHSRG